MTVACVVAVVGMTQTGCSNGAVSDPGTVGGASSAVGGSAALGGSAAVGGSGNVAGTGGVTVADCYSPTQNLPSAYQTGARGCACNEATDVDVCVQGVALICTSGVWMAVEDGPCMPQFPKTYSPATCSAAGGTPVPSPGTALSAEKDCASGLALGVIDFASSGWDEGGLCCAPASQPVAKACGARAGNTCAANEYCAYQAGEYCGAADAEATCKPRPEACVDLYAPICGCDGNTYGNSCVAAAAGTGIYSAGKCPN
ncbi:MAG TPA: hypothetical protein VIV60_01335 [Polyangiaceae bacterium]